MMSRKIRGHEKAQVRVIEEDGVLTLVSYTTPVVQVRYEKGRRLVTCSGLYSRTTIKHIGWFCRQELPGLTYYDVKAIAGKGEVAI